MRGFRIFLVLQVFSFTALTIANQVVTETVEAFGLGTSRTDAVTNAIVEAIGQVAGRFIEAETELKNIEVSVQDNDSSQYMASEVFQNRVKSATQGAVSSYRILNVVQKENDLFEATLSVDVLKVIPALSNRRRVVCATFGFPEAVSDKIVSQGILTRFRNQTSPQTHPLAAAFTDNLEAHLVQSRKFMVLDRRKTDAVAKERSKGAEGNIPVEDILRMSVDSIADFVLVGNVESLDFKRSTRKMRSGREIEIWEGFVEISFRVIDVNTRQVKFADRRRFTYSDSDLRRLSGTTEVFQSANLMLADAADQIGSQIVQAIFPVRVVSVRENSITLSEGGRGVQRGQVYDLFALGEEMFHPDTGEYIGQEELLIGQIQIQSVAARTSIATKKSEFTEEIREGYIARLSDVQETNQQESARPPRIQVDDLF